MIRYINTMVTFSEVPDMITLCIDICDCPCHCLKCHSPWLWDTWKWTENSKKEYGEPKELNIQTLRALIVEHVGIDCVAFLGGDNDPKTINKLAKDIKDNFDMSTAWYSGNVELSKDIDLANFNFIKLGPYIAEKGGLNNPNTNQKFYDVCRLSKLPDKFLLKDITNKFWK